MKIPESQKVNKSIVSKLIPLIRTGLVKGKGIQEPGKMCIEAAVCCAYGLPHSDNPPCVGSSVREYKIGLNDCNWESDMARAKGMEKLGVAQLGSIKLDQNLFKQFIFEQTQKDIIPLTFDWIPVKERIKEHEELKQFCIDNLDIVKLKEKFYNNNNYNYYYNNNNNYYNYYYYYYNYYYYYYNYYYYYYYNNYNNYYYYHCNNQLLLNSSAEVAVKVLQKMKSPGCKYLYLCDEIKNNNS